MIVQEQAWQREAQMRIQGGVGCRRESERGEEREREKLSVKEKICIFLVWDVLVFKD